MLGSCMNIEYPVETGITYHRHLIYPYTGKQLLRFLILHKEMCKSLQDFLIALTIPTEKDLIGAKNGRHTINRNTFLIQSVQIILPELILDKESHTRISQFDKLLHIARSIKRQVVQNLGNTPVVATDGVIISDVFNPVLTGITVTLDGVELDVGTGYTYNVATGEFATVDGVVTVPAATYTQDPTTGAVTTVPGVTVLTVSGTV